VLLVLGILDRAQLAVEGKGLLLVLEPDEDGGGAEVVGLCVDVVDEAVLGARPLDLDALVSGELVLEGGADAEHVLAEDELRFLVLTAERDRVGAVGVEDKGLGHSCVCLSCGTYKKRGRHASIFSNTI